MGEFVEIYKTKSDGTQEILAVCRLEAGIVKCEGDPIFIANLEKEGILDYTKKRGAKLFLRDGLRFLEELKHNFTSGYLNASEVKRAEEQK